MSDEVFGFEIGGAATDRNFLVRAWAKIFARKQYRFRVSEAPGQRNPEHWGGRCKLLIPDPRIAYLPFEFPRPDQLQEIGERIAAAIFQGQTIALFAECLTTAVIRGKALRVMFSYHNDADFLARTFPWESIFYRLARGHREHFGLSTALGVARFFPPHRDTYTPFEVDDRLCVLGVAANPKKCTAELGVNAELTTIEQLAQSLGEEIEFHPMVDTRWRNFETQLIATNPHVLFFTGHGGFVNDEPHLFFQNPDYSCEPVSMGALAAALLPMPRLKLVILSACQTAASRNPFVSGAEQLVAAGIPAVIAMQSKVDEEAAREFAIRFFNYLFQQDYPIDTCVNAGRQAMQDARRDRTEWAVPVLFLATRNEIFNFQPSSRIKAEESKKQWGMEEKFPVPVDPFNPRSELMAQLNLDFTGPRLTVVSGPPRSGKTQIISKFCIEKIRTRGRRDKTGGGNELFFYVRCEQEWTSFMDVLVELDLQTRSLGFKGFNEIIKDTARFGADKGIQMLSECLAQNHLVIVFDDFVWGQPEFWDELFLQLANHLRTSKVFVITSEPKYAGEGQQSHINVERFLPGDEFELNELELEVMRQLSVLRKPVTLDELAFMLAPDDPSRFLDAAKSVQASSLLTFTPNQGVELSKEQQVRMKEEMSQQDRKRFHQQAAIFYEGRANDISAAEKLFHEAESRENQ